MLDQLGIYTGRDAAGQTAEGSVSTSPDQHAANPPPQHHPAEPAPPPPAQPTQPAQPPPQAPAPPTQPAAPPEASTDLVRDMAKNFGKAIGEQQPGAEPPPAQPPPEPPKQKTWREEEPPANLTKKAQENWINYKAKALAEVEARDARISALEREAAQAKQTAQGETEQLRKQLAEAQGIVERVALERSPLFKTKVTDQEDLVRARLGKVAEGTGLTEQDLATLLNGDLNARENVLETKPITAYRKTQIIDLLSKWDDVEEQRSAMVSRGRDSLTEFVKQQQDAETARRAAFMAESVKIYEEQVALCTPKLEPYQTIEGNNEWNQNVANLKAASRRIFDGSVDRQTLAQVAILAPAAVVYQTLLQGAQKRIAQLEAQVNGYRGVTPTVRDRGADAPTPGSPSPSLSSPNGDFVKDIVGKFQKLTGMQ